MCRKKSKVPPTAFILIVILVTIGLLNGGCVTLAPTGTPPPGHVTPAPTIVPAPPAGTANGTVQVHFIDVGQGDSVLVRNADRWMLVDAGPIDAGPALASYLRSQGIKAIDVVVSTHPHADHIGGLLTVLNEFPVRTVYDIGIPHTTQTYEAYLTLIDQKDIRFVVPERGDTIDLGPGVTVQVLSPPSGGIPGAGLNENSMVLKITHGGVSFLLMSDAGSEAERVMLDSGYDLRSQVLKVGHHGSKSSSGKAFLEAVDPQVSVIEVGADNAYNHPAPATLDRLAAAGSAVYRTDRDGHVVVTSDGKGIVVSAQRQAPA
ncbi:MAG: ComEC family competence protein [Methanocella sp. PtaU1.Bin125]|nr:MAG: ComEC family competence protein [Methanocella sp. PtaU1.Bin125]